jgi:hypothetical protein
MWWRTLHMHVCESGGFALVWQAGRLAEKPNRVPFSRKGNGEGRTPPDQHLAGGNPRETFQSQSTAAHIQRDRDASLVGSSSLGTKCNLPCGSRQLATTGTQEPTKTKPRENPQLVNFDLATQTPLQRGSQSVPSITHFAQALA